MSQSTIAPHSHGAGVPASDRGERFWATDPLAFEVPSGREEEWRFTPMARLRGLHDGSAVTGGVVDVTVSGVAGAVAETVGRDDLRVGREVRPADRVAAAAFAGFDAATVVTIPAGVSVADPVVVTVRGRGFAAASYGHVLVDVEPGGSATVVLDHVGSATRADNVEVRVGEGARLKLVTLLGWDDDSVHLSAHHLTVGRDASLTHIAVTLGGDLVRVAPTVRFAGPGGEVELLGVFYTDPGQHQEHRLFVDHAQPHCRSDVNYRGALQGEGAHSVWIGDVLIRADAVGTQTYEINRNLLLTDGPRADSVPNLEIETGEVVGAGHASATGRFDDDQLFYLMARGITSEEARRLVVRGFFAEISGRIGVPAVEERLVEALEQELARGVAS